MDIKPKYIVKTLWNYISCDPRDFDESLEYYQTLNPKEIFKLPNPEGGINENNKELYLKINYIINNMPDETFSGIDPFVTLKIIKELAMAVND